MATMTGNLVMGNIAGSARFPTQGKAALGTISSGLNLANVGELSKSGMALTDMFSKDRRIRKGDRVSYKDPHDKKVGADHNLHTVTRTRGDFAFLKPDNYGWIEKDAFKKDLVKVPKKDDYNRR